MNASPCVGEPQGGGMDSAFLLSALFARTAEKITIIGAAVCLIYFGYRLFYLTEDRSSEMEASGAWGKIKLVKAAPGVLFTLFGSAILLVALTRGITIGPHIDIKGITTQDVTFGAAEASALNTTECARSANVGIRQLELVLPGAPAEGIKLEYTRARDGLEDILSYCINRMLGANSYKKYKEAQAKIARGDADVSEDSRQIYQRVSQILAN